MIGITSPLPLRRTRWYIGAVLLLLILGLGYMAWRQMQNSQASHGVSAPPPVAAPPTPHGRAPERISPQRPTSDLQRIRRLNKAKSEGIPANTARGPMEAAKANAAKAAEPPAAPPCTKSLPQDNETSSRATPTPPADRWGAEELAVAQRYLNGANGQRRDTAEAAKWLWKSIAKHNGQATLLLADLYLKGNGVPKNCDQARILLDSAARKGVSGAGERLRNLPAFGCQ